MLEIPNFTHRMRIGRSDDHDERRASWVRGSRGQDDHDERQLLIRASEELHEALHMIAAAQSNREATRQALTHEDGGPESPWLAARLQEVERHEHLLTAMELAATNDIRTAEAALRASALQQTAEPLTVKEREKMAGMQILKTTVRHWRVAAISRIGEVHRLIGSCRIASRYWRHCALAAAFARLSAVLSVALHSQQTLCVESIRTAHAAMRRGLTSFARCRLRAATRSVNRRTLQTHRRSVALLGTRRSQYRLRWGIVAWREWRERRLAWREWRGIALGRWEHGTLRRSFWRWHYLSRAHWLTAVLLVRALRGKMAAAFTGWLAFTDSNQLQALVEAVTPGPLLAAFRTWSQIASGRGGDRTWGERFGWRGEHRWCHHWGLLGRLGSLGRLVLFEFLEDDLTLRLRRPHQRANRLRQRLERLRLGHPAIVPFVKARLYLWLRPPEAVDRRARAYCIWKHTVARALWRQASVLQLLPHTRRAWRRAYWVRWCEGVHCLLRVASALARWRRSGLVCAVRRWVAVRLTMCARLSMSKRAARACRRARCVAGWRRWAAAARRRRAIGKTESAVRLRVIQLRRLCGLDGLRKAQEEGAEQVRAARAHYRRRERLGRLAQWRRRIFDPLSQIELEPSARRGSSRGSSRRIYDPLSQIELEPSAEYTPEDNPSERMAARVRATPACLEAERILMACNKERREATVFESTVLQQAAMVQQLCAHRQSVRLRLLRRAQASWIEGCRWLQSRVGPVHCALARWTQRALSVVMSAWVELARLRRVPQRQFILLCRRHTCFALFGWRQAAIRRRMHLTYLARAAQRWLMSSLGRHFICWSHHVVAIRRRVARRLDALGWHRLSHCVRTLRRWRNFAQMELLFQGLVRRAQERRYGADLSRGLTIWLHSACALRRRHEEEALLTEYQAKFAEELALAQELVLKMGGKPFATVGDARQRDGYERHGERHGAVVGASLPRVPTGIQTSHIMVPTGIQTNHKWPSDSTKSYATSPTEVRPSGRSQWKASMGPSSPRSIFDAPPEPEPKDKPEDKPEIFDEPEPKDKPEQGRIEDGESLIETDEDREDEDELMNILNARFAAQRPRPRKSPPCKSPPRKSPLRKSPLGPASSNMKAVMERVDTFMSTMQVLGWPAELPGEAPSTRTASGTDWSQGQLTPSELEWWEEPPGASDEAVDLGELRF